MLVQTCTEKEGKHIVFPFDLGELAPDVELLTDGWVIGLDNSVLNYYVSVFVLSGNPLANGHSVVQMIVGIFGTNEDLCRHKEQMLKIVGILNPSVNRKTVGVSVIFAPRLLGDGIAHFAQGMAFFISLVANTSVIAFASNALSGNKSLQVMLVIGRKEVKLTATAIDGVPNMFRYGSYVIGEFLHMVATAAIFANSMKFGGELRIVGCFKIRSRSK